ncbi:MAG: hypothetical protein ORN51_11230 [Akkermansiaceae bacterium]|nr:hypothetical protein [Akkermansiaceae bacterium]
MNIKSLVSVFAVMSGLGQVRAIEVKGEVQKLLGIETIDLAARSLPPEIVVFGSVLSPAPVIDLIRQISTARATVDVSQVALERVEKLFVSGNLVAGKEVQAARAQQELDKAALQALEDRLVLEWGPWFSVKSRDERDKLVGDLLAGRQSIIRLSIPRGEASVAKPVAARLHSFGQKKSSMRLTEIFPALSVDAAYQAQSYVGVIENKDASLAVGLSLTGAMEFEGKPREGMVVPQAAVVFYLGKAWIYQKSGDEEFERLEISIESPVDGGWFLVGDAIKPDDVVIKGVQSLLSQETLGPAEEK